MSLSLAITPFISIIISNPQGISFAEQQNIRSYFSNYNMPNEETSESQMRLHDIVKVMQTELE